MEVFEPIFHSFEAGIADAISGFKWMKKTVYLWKMDISNIEVSVQLSIYQKLFYQIAHGWYFHWSWNRIYTRA